MKKAILLPLLLSVLLLARSAQAQWNSSTSINNAVCVTTASSSKSAPKSCSDGAGGVIITWSDYRTSGTNANIYAQRIDANGSVKWTANGVAVCAAVGNQTQPDIVSDGMGGAIIVWADGRQSGYTSVYAQHLNANGTALWAANGISAGGMATNSPASMGVSVPAPIQSIHLAADGVGGAFIAIKSVNFINCSTCSSNYQTSYSLARTSFVGNITGFGSAPFNQGAPYSDASTSGDFQVVSNGPGQAIIAWADDRPFSSTTGNLPIGLTTLNLQLVDTSSAYNMIGLGSSPSSCNCSTPFFYDQFPVLAADPSGGAIVAWMKTPSGGGSPACYVQKVNTNGALQWASGGIQLGQDLYASSVSQMTIGSDGIGGALVAYPVNGNALTVKKVLSTQSFSALNIAPATGHQTNPAIITAGNGDAIVSWTDDRNGSSNLDIYAQKITAAGAFAWTANGIPVANAANTQDFATLVSDGAGGALLAWDDLRNSGGGDIYASRLFSNGTPVCPTQATVTALGPTSYCLGGNVMLQADSLAGNTFQWKFNNANIAGATTRTYKAINAGAYTVAVTNGCTNISSVTNVTTYSLPTVPIVTTSRPTSFCPGDSTVLTVSAQSNLTYQWYNNALLLTGATNASYTARTAGSYTVKVFNSSGCSATSAAKAVTVYALPAATMTPAGAASTCSGTPLILRATPVSGCTYTWTKNGVVTSVTTANDTVSVAGNYTVTVTSSAGCSNTSTATAVTVLTVPAVSVVSANKSTSFCVGDSVILSTPPVSGITYQWQNNGTNISGATAPSYVVKSTGNYILKAIASNGCSSVSASTATIANALPAVPVLTATGAGFCLGGSVGLSTPAVNGNTYQWKVAGTPISGATAANYIAQGGGTYTLTTTNPAGCSATSAAKNVAAYPLPTAAITPANTASTCSGTPLVLTAASASGCTYTWKKGGVTTSVTTMKDTVNAAGSYTVTTTNSYGCTNTSPATVVTVLPVPAVSVISANGPLTFCAGDSVTLSTPPVSGVTYQWQKNAVNISTATSSSYVAKLTGSYTIKAINVNGCTSVSSATAVIANALPVAPVVTATATGFCPGSSMVLSTTAVSGINYQWKLAGTAISGANNPTYTASTAGSYTLTATNGTGCVATSSPKSIVTYAVPTASITVTGNTTVNNGDSVKLTANTGSGYTWQWQKNTTDITGATAQIYYAKSTGNYTVKVTNGYGCSATSAVKAITVIGNKTSLGVTQHNSTNEAQCSLYPNPNGGRFTLQMEANDLSGFRQTNVVVTNVSGQVVFQDVVDLSQGGRTLLNLGDHLPAGLYLLQIQTPKMRKGLSFQITR